MFYGPLRICLGAPHVSSLVESGVIHPYSGKEAGLVDFSCAVSLCCAVTNGQTSLIVLFVLIAVFRKFVGLFCD